MSSKATLDIPEVLINNVQEVVERVYLHNPEWPAKTAAKFERKFGQATTPERIVAMTIAGKIAEQFELKERA